MPTSPWKAASVLTLAALFWLTPSALLAQNPPPAEPVPAPADVAPAAAGKPPSDQNRDAVVTLSPFEVQSASDRSYGALNSNSLTSFNTALNRLPISADVYNSTFMDDTASTTVEEMIATYSAGAGLGASVGDPSGSTAPLPFDRGSVYQGVQLRGLGSTVTKEDGFMVPTPTAVGLTSNFGLERVEIINGPQALLYGNGGGGGVVNLISKQAPLGQPSTGSAKFQVDQYGNKSAQLDYGTSAGNVAVWASYINQELGSYRIDIGGELRGYYTQVAVRAFGNTIIRLTGKQTSFDRFVQTAPTLNFGSALIDGRNGLSFHSILDTNQVYASATGPSGAGPIDNGLLTWQNDDAYAGDLHSELTTGKFSELTAETTWTKWLSTQLSVGYQSNTDRYGNAGTTIYSPDATSNPLTGNWTEQAAAGASFINQEPQRTKAIRFTALSSNDLFGDRAHSQTILGVDFSRLNTANIAYEYYQADGNWNPVVNPASASNNGRTVMPAVNWTVNNGPVKYPIWPVGTGRITMNGTNYILMIANEVNPAAVSPSNPEGVTVNGSFYLQNEFLNRGLYGVNYTEWLGGKLTTLAGFRYTDALYALNNQSGHLGGKASNFSEDVGANYELLPWLRPYFSASNSFNLPLVALNPNPTDPYGAAPPISSSQGGEVGLKIGDQSGKVSGSLAFYAVNTKNEQYLIATSLLNDINPSGLDGRLGAPSTYIIVNRKSEGVEAALTAAPTPNWRLRLSAAVAKGTIGNTTSYAQLYNDQFNENSQGQVTYADGTVVYVNATFNSKSPVATATTAGAVPLTVAAMSNASSIYYANPVAITGQITASSDVGIVLKTVDPVHGSMLTGKVGLPISDIQINPGFALPGTIITSQAGDSTTGYPEISTNLTSVYTFSTGWLNGFKAGGTMSLAWRRPGYYDYNLTGIPDGEFFLPIVVRFDGIFGYERKFRRVTWSAQVNVNNMFNRYELVTQTSNFDQTPRDYIFTTTVKF